MVPATSFTHKYQVKILTEAFRRNGWNFQLEYYKDLKKLIAQVEQGSLDGDSPRGINFAAGDAHPGYVKIDSVLYSIETGAYTTEPLPIIDWDSLADLNMPVGYVTGVFLHENELGERITPDNLIGLKTRADGFAALSDGQIKVFVMVNHTNAMEMIRSDRFKDAGIRRVAVLNAVDVCAYFTQKHQALAPVIAATLKQMKTEGLFDKCLEETMEGR